MYWLLIGFSGTPLALVSGTVIGDDTGIIVLKKQNQCIHAFRLLEEAKLCMLIKCYVDDYFSQILMYVRRMY